MHTNRLGKLTIRAATSLFVLAFVSAAAAQDSLLDDLQQQCSTICQPADAAWRTVPWQTDLLKAQHLAVEQGKPIFIWAMDGHPLGCT